MTTTYPFQTQAVRDLAWACFAPPLILTSQLETSGRVEDCRFALDTQRLAWLEQLDREPGPLLAWLEERRSHRLGLYFEALWQFFLRHDSRCELLAHNLPVHDGNRTLGEFDCLYRCLERGETVHLELAVKYYLCTGGPADGDGLAQWLGPDARDRLDLKIDHLLQRQLSLGDTAAAQHTLAQLGIEPTRREAAVRGYLFGRTGNTPPPGFNPEQHLHRWLTRAELDGIDQPDPQDRFLILPKMRWLSQAQRLAHEDALDAAQLTTALAGHFSGGDYPALVVALDAGGIERERFFVTGNDWPGRAESSQPARSLPQRKLADELATR